MEFDSIPMQVVQKEYGVHKVLKLNLIRNSQQKLEKFLNLEFKQSNTSLSKEFYKNNTVSLEQIQYQEIKTKPKLPKKKKKIIDKPVELDLSSSESSISTQHSITVNTSDKNMTSEDENNQIAARRAHRNEDASPVGAGVDQPLQKAGKP